MVNRLFHNAALTTDLKQRRQISKRRHELCQDFKGYNNGVFEGHSRISIFAWSGPFTIWTPRCLIWYQHRTTYAVSELRLEMLANCNAGAAEVVMVNWICVGRDEMSASSLLRRLIKPVKTRWKESERNAEQRQKQTKETKKQEDMKDIFYPSFCFAFLLTHRSFAA